MTEKLNAWFLHYKGNWKNERSMNYIGCPESNAPFFVSWTLTKLWMLYLTWNKFWSLWHLCMKL